MPSDSRKQQLSVVVDAALIEQVDALTDDRDRAIAEGLRLWCAQQAGTKLQKTADTHRKRHNRDETGWLV